ncbi:MAG TPA: VTT domain-containing protein [Acidimicrobiia bacterium]|jgi:membrane-associated protein
MGSFAKNVIDNWGIWGLLLVVFIESGIIPLPLPGDSLLFLAGFFASTSAASNDPHTNLAAVVFGTLAVAVIGAQIGYAIGAIWGTKLFKPDARVFKTNYLDRSQEFFDRRGPAAVILARFVPFVRTIVPMLAGASSMKHRQFAIANVVGAVLWTVGISLLGFTLGQHIPEGWIEPITVLIVALSLIPPLLEWRKHRNEFAAQTAESVET